MSGKTEPETKLVLYLLGDISSSERELLEAEYFSDEEAFQKVLDAEDDLIDAYARGALSEKHRRLFEKRFLQSDDGRERVRFARTLAETIGNTPFPVAKAPVPIAEPRLGLWATLWSRSPALSFAVVAVAVVLTGGMTALLVERRSMRNELEALRVEREALQQKVVAEQARNSEFAEQNEQLKEQLAQLNQQSPEAPPGIKPPLTGHQDVANQRTPQTNRDDTLAQNRGPQIVLTLIPGALRGSLSGNNFTIHRAVKRISIRLEVVNAAAESYRAAIETADGEPVRSFDLSKPATAENILDLPPVPASELPSGVYIITLQGKQSDGSFRKIAEYSFTLIKQ